MFYMGLIIRAKTYKNVHRQDDSMFVASITEDSAARPRITSRMLSNHVYTELCCHCLILLYNLWITKHIVRHLVWYNYNFVNIMSTFEMETIIFTNTFELIYLQSKNNLYIWSFDNETISGCFKTWFPCSFERRGPTHVCFQQMTTKWLTIAECLKTRVESRMNILIIIFHIPLVNTTNWSW